MQIPLPDKYAWLGKEPGPKMILEFVKIYGITEAPGAADNPIITGWAKEVGVDKDYKHDSLAWCGLEAAIISLRGGYEVVKNPLWARNWLNWGVPVDHGKLGYMLIFSRPGGGGHVGLYVAEDDICYHVAGGNEGDKSNIVRMEKSRILGIRMPKYKIAEPPNVRKIIVSPQGTVLSHNEG